MLDNEYIQNRINDLQNALNTLKETRRNEYSKHLYKRNHILLNFIKQEEDIYQFCLNELNLVKQHLF